jgi:two-component system, LytTR family, sensor kinase
MKNPFKPARIEWLTFFALAPVIVAMMHLLLFNDPFPAGNILMISYPIVFLYIFGSWYLHITVMHVLRVKYPSFRQTRKRIIWLFTSHLFLTSSSLMLIFLTYHYFNLFGYVLDPAKLSWCLVIGLILTLVATGSWEGSYIYQLWKESLHEKELLQNIGLQQEFDSLKEQVNPHFLFNSLNSLSTLIHENPTAAEKFLDEMSSVYRYILKNDIHELADLNTELRFIQSYFHLLKTRYNEGLNLIVNIREDLKELFIPPLTLQLLVENAVKHNVVHKEEPLTIEINNEEDFLVVSNNLQRKSTRIQSGKVGLSNINARYHLLGYPDIQVSETEQKFSVRIPLIH